MTLVGLDFDNTLVCYDKLFYQLALEKRLINTSLPPDKTVIRDYLRSQGKDEQFTFLQGEVYGLKILDASPAEGMLEALQELKAAGLKMKLISHKTKYPYKGPRYNLRDAALKWLKKHEFFSEGFLGWSDRDIHFADTAEEKISTISQINCDYFVDDLETILSKIGDNIKKICYDPKEAYTKKIDGINYSKSWSEIVDIVKHA